MRYLYVVPAIFVVTILTSIASAGIWQENFDFEGDDDMKFRDSGRIGFITYEANAHYDNLIIDGEEIPAFAVEPKDKLATYWGRLKTDVRIQ